ELRRVRGGLGALDLDVLALRLEPPVLGLERRLLGLDVALLRDERSALRLELAVLGGLGALTLGRELLRFLGGLGPQAVEALPLGLELLVRLFERHLLGREVLLLPFQRLARRLELAILRGRGTL